jgi:hypothetical protein
VQIISYLKKFEESAKHLLLIYLVASGITINSNVLYLLSINNENLISLNLQNFILIDSILKAENFHLLKDLNLIQKLGEGLNQINQKGGPLKIENKQEVLGAIFENIAFGKEETDFFAVQSKFNDVFRDLKRDVDSIK